MQRRGSATSPPSKSTSLHPEASHTLVIILVFLCTLVFFYSPSLCLFRSLVLLLLNCIMNISQSQNHLALVSIHITPSPPGGLTHFGRNPLESIDTTITPMKSLSSSICVASRSHSVVSRQLPCLASQHLSVRVEWAAGLEIFTAPKLKIRLSGEPHIQW